MNMPALFQSMHPKDRRLLFVALTLIGVLFVLLAIFTPARDPNNNPVPDSYLSGTHGAKAAFSLLQQSGYTVERWELPLGELAVQSGPGMVVILAEPYSGQPEDKLAIGAILEKGGKVIATGAGGGFLLPENALKESKAISFVACEAQPEGLQPLAGSGPVWIEPRATWQVGGARARADVRTAYTCGAEPVVVEYPVGKGRAVWWASSTPLENGSITRGQNLELLLNSVGSASGQHVYWDESLHGMARSPWDYTKGPVWPLLWIGAIGLALLVVLSYSRRSGPLRELPKLERTNPIEFLDALGSLYRSTGAASTVVTIAWDRFRMQAALLTGQLMSNQDARQLAAAIERRFGSASAGMEDDMVAAEEACWQDALKPQRALALVQALRRHEETLRAASSQAGGGLASKPAG